MMQNNDETDIELNEDILSLLSKNDDDQKIVVKKTNLLQRNLDWFLERLGCWNGSQLLKLMSSSPKGARLSWHHERKYLYFGDGCLKHIFEVAKQRETKRLIISSSTKEMKYGESVEDFIFQRANEVLKPKGLYLEKVGYKKFEDIENSGVSCDAIVRRIDDNSIVATCEIKACTTWSTVFDRTFELMSEKSKDFWQVQGQMGAYKVDKSYYFVATPPSDINKYLNVKESGEDVVESLYEDWLKETELDYQIVEVSKIHLDNLFKRISIAEKIIDKYLKTKENIKDIMHEVLDDEKGIVRIVDLEKKTNEGKKNIDVNDIIVNDFEIIKINKEEIKTEEKNQNNENWHDDLPF